MKTSELHSLCYKNIELQFNLIYSGRRTLEIAILKEGKIVVRAPRQVSLMDVKSYLLKKIKWILPRLQYYREFKLKNNIAKYADGEEHLFMGRKYPIKIIKDCHKFFFVDQENYISYKGNITELKIKRLLFKWYRKQSSLIFFQALDRCWIKFKEYGFCKPQLNIRIMRRRWGSLKNKTIITLNLSLIKVSVECLEYVIFHELCHLKYTYHNKDFYNFLGIFVPKWRSLDRELNELQLLER